MNKRTCLNILLGLCAILLFTNSSCNPDPDENGPTLSVLPTIVTLEADGTGQTIRVTSNTTWTAVSRDSWLKCSPAGGTGGNSITVSADINTGAERSTKLTLSDKTGRVEVEVHVTQKKDVAPTPSDPMLTVKPSTLNFNSSAGSNSFSIESNTKWTVKSDQTWCTVNTSSGSNNGTVTVNVTENTSTSARNATIIIDSDKASSVQVSINQSGASLELNLNKNDLSFSAAGGSDTFSITSNANWTITSNHNWFTLNMYSGSNNATVIVSVSENTSTFGRSDTITVKTEEIVHKIIVMQAGAKSVDQSLETFKVKGVSFKMIRIEGGTFTMGATTEQGSDAKSNELPAHRVTLSTYYMGETEVTQELWRAVMNNDPSWYNGEQNPVENVSWILCKEFIVKLNAMTGYSFRFPTEAEWEFAARGGNKCKGYKYSGSNTIDNVAWYSENSYKVGSSSSDYGTHPVATKNPNELGLYDMSGNVAEWCQDWYSNYSSNNQTDPTGPENGEFRVCRGGWWFLDAESCRVSSRAFKDPSSKSYFGLRLAL